MPLSEFEIIARYFSGDRFAVADREDISVPIGDDAAVITPEAGKELVVAVDTLIEGVHFPSVMCPYDIGYRALAVNLSDLAAMGARPRWFTLALTMPEVRAEWLDGFSTGLAELAQQSRCALVGGDTTRGPLTISVQVSGEVPSGEALLRTGACAGDVLFVSGYPGTAALGLQHMLAGNIDSQAARTFLRPTPRLQLGQGLRRLASAAIDVSDGLLADLGHIVSGSGVGAELDCSLLPDISTLGTMTEAEVQALQLTGGDDYELCFSVPAAKVREVTDLAEACATPCHQIGHIKAGSGVSLQGTEIAAAPEATGYKHF